jgi:hypothetical protein
LIPAMRSSLVCGLRGMVRATSVHAAIGPGSGLSPLAHPCRCPGALLGGLQQRATSARSALESHSYPPMCWLLNVDSQSLGARTCSHRRRGLVRFLQCSRHGEAPSFHVDEHLRQDRLPQQAIDFEITQILRRAGDSNDRPHAQPFLWSDWPRSVRQLRGRGRQPCWPHCRQASSEARFSNHRVTSPTVVSDTHLRRAFRDVELFTPLPRGGHGARIAREQIRFDRADRPNQLELVPRFVVWKEHASDSVRTRP